MTAPPRSTPPRGAERLLRWSLALSERAAVLGDLEEEFTTLVDEAGLTQAVGWYWRQSVTSIIPNLSRRLRQALRHARVVVGPKDQLRRQQNKRRGVWTLVAALLVGALFSAKGDVKATLAFAGPIAVLGAIFLVASQFRTTPFDGRSRRGRLIATSYLCLWVPWWFLDRHFSFSVTTHGLADGLGMDLLLLIWLGPDALAALWPSVQKPLGEVYLVKSPRVSWSSDPVGPVYGTTEVPREPFAMSRPILGLGAAAQVRVADAIDSMPPMQVTINRTFAVEDVLRLFAAVNATPADLKASLVIRDVPSGRLVRSMSATVSEATVTVPPRTGFVDLDEALPSRPSSALAAIDVTFPLADLKAGAYSLRLAATDGTSSSHEDTEIVVGASDQPSGGRT